LGGGSLVATVDKFAFPADTRSTLGTGLSAARRAVAGMANSGVAGYFGGGIQSGDSRVTTVDKYAFPADTRTSLGTGLSSARGEAGAVANEGVF
jgi:formylmethanofuran:tetrahydromethanopterin formyltransferase